VFLAADHFVQQARAHKVVQVVHDRVTTIAATLGQIPTGVELATNHTWARNEKDSVVTVGVDEFIARFIGTVENIVLPMVGEFAERVIFVDGERKVTLACPVNGRVIAVNPEILRDPTSAHADPYGKGWLFKVQVPAGHSFRMSIAGSSAEWLRDQFTSAREFFLGRAGAQNYALMQDGGEIVDGVLKMYDNAVWVEFSEKFLTAGAETIAAATAIGK